MYRNASSTHTHGHATRPRTGQCAWLRCRGLVGVSCVRASFVGPPTRPGDRWASRNGLKSLISVYLHLHSTTVKATRNWRGRYFCVVTGGEIPDAPNHTTAGYSLVVRLRRDANVNYVICIACADYTPHPPRRMSAPSRVATWSARSVQSTQPDARNRTQPPPGHYRHNRGGVCMSVPRPRTSPHHRKEY